MPTRAVPTRAARSPRSAATREAILATAERLFAEHGLAVVSNRQISEAAGQGNTAAVGYHFGTKEDLVRAIARRRAGEIDARRAAMVAGAGDSREVRDWVACLVRPTTDVLSSLGGPTWYARFGAQVMTDPALRAVMIEDSLGSGSLRAALDGLSRCLPGLPPAVWSERSDMVRQLMVHMTAERERALAEGTFTPHRTWSDAASGLIDAITGIWTAPVGGTTHGTTHGTTQRGVG